MQKIKYKYIFLGIDFPSHVMLGQSVAMKCSYSKKENQQVTIKCHKNLSTLYLFGSHGFVVWHITLYISDW